MDQEQIPPQENTAIDRYEADDGAISLSSGPGPASQAQGGNPVESGSVRIRGENRYTDTAGTQPDSDLFTSVQEIPSQEAREAIQGIAEARKKRVIKKYKTDIEEPPRSTLQAYLRRQRKKRKKT